MNIKNEFKNPQLGDKGLNHRLEYLAEAFSKNNGESISFSCQDWKSSKAAYRFFDNDNFQAEEILKPHIKQTLNRMNALDENDMSLILHDSSEITFSNTGHELVFERAEFNKNLFLFFIAFKDNESPVEQLPFCVGFVRGAFSSTSFSAAGEWASYKGNCIFDFEVCRQSFFGKFYFPLTNELSLPRSNASNNCPACSYN